MNRVRLFLGNRIMGIKNAKPEQTDEFAASVFEMRELSKQKRKRNSVMKLASLCFLVLAFAVVSSSSASAANRFSVATGNWNATTTWSATSGGASGAAVPVAADVVTIESGFTVTVTAAAVCTTLTIANTSTLSLTSGSNNLTISNGGLVTVNSGGSVVFNATSVVDGGGNGSNGIALTINSGANLTTANPNGFATTVTTNTVATGSFAINRGSGPVVSYSTTANYTYNGSAAQITGTALTGANNLTINNGAGVTLTSGTTVASGGTLNIVAGTFAAGTNLTMATTSSITRSGGNMTGTPQGAGVYNVTYTSNSMTTTTELAGSGLNNVTVNLTAGQTLTLDQNRAPDGNLSVTTGIFDLSTFTINRSASGGTLTVSNGATLKIGGTNTFPSNYATHTLGATSTVEYSGAAQTVSAESYGNLTVSGSAGKTLSSNASVAGTLTLNVDITTTGATSLTQSGTSAGTGDVVGNVSRTDLAGAATRAFGNPNVQITVSTGTITSMTVNLVKQSPTGFSSAVTRTYVLTPGAGTVSSATVRLHYLTGELNGNAEGATLHLWRFTGGLWVDEGQSSTTAGSFVEKTGAPGFSPWTIASGGSAPTAVNMVDMKATRYDNRVLLEWQTGYEVSNVGFNIYREEKGNLVKVTPEPVAGSALLFGPQIELKAGFSYSWWDNNAGNDANTRYWVEDLDLSGGTAMRGPFGVVDAPQSKRTPPEGKGKVSLLSALGSSDSEVSTSAPVQSVAKQVKLTAALLVTQTGIASQQAVKLSVKSEGWYRVGQTDLVAAGLSASVDPNKLQLIVDGQEVPILLTTPGSSPGKGQKLTTGWDGIEFYGVGIDSPFTDSHVYWLVAGLQNGLRINKAPATGGTPGPVSFAYAVERRDKVRYFPALKNGGAEKFFGPLIANAQPVNQSVTLQHVASASPDLATLEVSIQGFTDTPHNVQVVLNGTPLGTIQFSSLSKGVAQYSIPNSSLIEGSNQIQLIGPAGFSDMSLAEYVRITYQHTNGADANALKFPLAGGAQATIGGFTSSSVRVVDVTNRNAPQELTAAIDPDGATFTAMVTAPGTGARTLLAFASDQQKAPSALVANQPSSWGTKVNAADYVAVTRQELISSIQPLITQRRNQGLKTASVDIEDVYDEFSFGNKTPQALKDFFFYALTNWKKAPHFAVLVGDASYDPKNYLGVGDFDLVPTKLIETAFNETATDDWFVDVNGDEVPDIAIGRLPVRTAQEAAAMVAKIVRYDSSEAIPRVTLVADHFDGYDFEAASTQLQPMIPGSVTVTDIRRGQVGDSNARSQLLTAINQGQKLINFYGHGSSRVWTDGPILNATDAPNLTNVERLSLFDAMTCLNGLFQNATVESLGEALMKAEGGAIAVWASSGMTDPAAQVLMNQQAIQLLFSGTGLTIGEVTAQAKAATNNADVRRTWVLLGDPATKLK